MLDTLQGALGASGGDFVVLGYEPPLRAGPRYLPLSSLHLGDSDRRAIILRYAFLRPG